MTQLTDFLIYPLSDVETIIGKKIASYAAIQIAAKLLLKTSANSVLIQGGHFARHSFDQDYWTNGVESFWLSTFQPYQKNISDVTCIFSSAITENLALGYEI